MRTARVRDSRPQRAELHLPEQTVGVAWEGAVLHPNPEVVMSERTQKFTEVALKIHSSVDMC